MNAELSGAFHDYINVIEPKFEGIRQSLNERIIRIQRNALVQGAVEALEGQSEFENLVSETRRVFQTKHEKSAIADHWKHAVKNFFRRSGCYLTIFEAHEVEVKVLFERFETAFGKDHYTVTYLVPMELVRFAKSFLEFDSFGIRKLDRDELNELFSNSVNKVFYPWAMVDTEQLLGLWFICQTTSLPAKKVGGSSILDDPDLWKVREFQLEFTSYPRILERTIELLALYNWREDEEPVPNDGLGTQKDASNGWERFCMPVVLSTNDDLLIPPYSNPPLPPLTTQLVGDGEELIEVPFVHLDLSKERTESFEEFVRRTDKLLSELKTQENQWDFFDRALGFFAKAFVAPDGPEQLLWHITMIEALLGENKEGITVRLARRLSRILGKVEEERKAIGKQFRELYDFRCNLVHGDNFEKKFYAAHLSNARSLARRTLLWFLHLLAEIQREFSRGASLESVLTRDEILVLLDLEEDERRRISRLAQSLPAKFPYVSGWVADT